LPITLLKKYFLILNLRRYGGLIVVFLFTNNSN
jgi:hypothetical protein